MRVRNRHAVFTVNTVPAWQTIHALWTLQAVASGAAIFAVLAVAPVFAVLAIFDAGHALFDGLARLVVPGPNVSL